MTQKELIEDLERDIQDEMNKENEIAKVDLNDYAKTKLNIMQRVYWTIFGKLFRNFRIKITLYYKDSVLFEYQFPNEVKSNE